MSGSQGNYKDKVFIMRKLKIIIVVLVIFIGITYMVPIGFFVIGKISEYKAAIDTKENNKYHYYKDNLDRDRNEKEPKVITESPYGEEYNGISYYDNSYKGTIEKIEDNKIYFLVDKKAKKYSGIANVFFDVEDYEVVFDMGSFKLEYDPLKNNFKVSQASNGNLEFESIYYDGDYLTYNFRNFHSAGEMEFLVDEDLTVNDSKYKYDNRDYTIKSLSFLN